MNKGKLVGTFAGIAAGALIGILYAPEKGSTTRKQIKDKSDGFVNKIKSNAFLLFATVAKEWERTKNYAEYLTEEQTNKLEDIKSNAKENIKNEVIKTTKSF